MTKIAETKECDYMHKFNHVTNHWEREGKWSRSLLTFFKMYWRFGGVVGVVGLEMNGRHGTLKTCTRKHINCLSDKLGNKVK